MFYTYLLAIVRCSLLIFCTILTQVLSCAQYIKLWRHTLRVWRKYIKNHFWKAVDVTHTKSWFHNFSKTKQNYIIDRPWTITHTK